MAISTQGTVLKIKNKEADLVTVNIKSFPDLGAAPAAIDVTDSGRHGTEVYPGSKGSCSYGIRS